MSATEIQTRTRCPKCEPRLLGRPLGCVYCQDGWVYAWVDPNSLYLSDNPSVQATVDAALRKVPYESTKCIRCGVIATHQLDWPTGVVHYCVGCYNGVVLRAVSDV